MAGRTGRKSFSSSLAGMRYFPPFAVVNALMVPSVIARLIVRLLRPVIFSSSVMLMSCVGFTSSVSRMVIFLYLSLCVSPRFGDVFSIHEKDGIDTQIGTYF